MGDRFRVGRSLGTTVYQADDDSQPVAWFPGDPFLAGLVVQLLNRLTNCMDSHDPGSSERQHCTLPEGHTGMHESAGWVWL